MISHGWVSARRTRTIYGRWRQRHPVPHSATSGSHPSLYSRRSRRPPDQRGLGRHFHPVGSHFLCGSRDRACWVPLSRLGSRWREILRMGRPSAGCETFAGSCSSHPLATCRETSPPLLLERSSRVRHSRLASWTWQAGGRVLTTDGARFEMRRVATNEHRAGRKACCSRDCD